MTPHVRWDAMLAVLARATPASIRLSRVDMRFDGRRPECAVRGRAAGEPGSDGTAAIKAYMEALGASPIVQKCTLASARRAEGDGGKVQEFEVIVTLVGLPAELDLALGGPEGAP
jgi:hypothetical protein